MQKIYDSWVEPLPKKLAQVAKDKGGDLLDVDADIDRIVLELDYSYLFEASTAKVDKTMRDTYNGFKTIIEGYQDSGLLAKDVQLPLFQNDCYYPQDYFGRLKPEKLALARRVQAEVDPNGFWKTRTGGFKIPSAY
ncbi:hypothetical protein NUW58_g10612 [Xylaria curta]|uniref:Uncharacterized protein n=1 Tax=Xylaria curta TaxID=42375 RepID=A0ACC1MK02_9PEZI|nr:hypothetical protein NUW58_g10612 [Xylaria curta]